MKLLLLEPDPHLGERLQQSLESEGFVVDVVGTLADARRTATEADYAAIVMDLLDPVRGPMRATGAAQAEEATLNASGPSDVEVWFG